MPDCSNMSFSWKKYNSWDISYKVEGVVEWEGPKSVTKIMSFMGLVDYYSRFIEGLSKVVAPLRQITHKGQPFEWPYKCE